MRVNLMIRFPLSNVLFYSFFSTLLLVWLYLSIEILLGRDRETADLLSRPRLENIVLQRFNVCIDTSWCLPLQMSESKSGEKFHLSVHSHNFIAWMFRTVIKVKFPNLFNRCQYLNWLRSEGKFFFSPWGKLASIPFTVSQIAYWERVQLFGLWISFASFFFNRWIQVWTY